ncbi:MAG TPA: MFS transporter [Actinoplanes sp.]|jgi:MFS family permease
MGGVRETVPAPGFGAFVILWAGQFVSLTGSSLSSFALGVYVYQQTGSATALGIIYALAGLPFLVASPFTGSLVDRWGAHRSLLVGNIGALLVTLVLAGLLGMDVFVPWHVSVIVAALSALSALDTPAFEASVPLLVAKRHIGRANGLRLIAQGTSRILAPLAAGFLLLAIGIEGIVVMDCLSFAAGIVTLLFVRIPLARRSGAPVPARAGALLAEFRSALRYVADRPGLPALLGFLAVLEFCGGIVDLSMTPLVLSFGSSGDLGVVLSIGGAGMAVASLAVTAWGGPRRRVRGILGFTLVLAAATVLGSLRPNLTLIAAAAVFFLGGLAIVIGSNKTLWQTKVEPRLLGRVMALQNMVVSVPQMLAYASAGLIADYLFVPLAGPDRVRGPVLAALIGDGHDRGVALMMMVTGVVLAVAVLVAYRYPPLRRLEDELPDVTPEDEPAAQALS